MGVSWICLTYNFILRGRQKGYLRGLSTAQFAGSNPAPASRGGDDLTRYKAMFLGMVIACAVLVVPSYAASTTPSYPSGTAFSYMSSVAPSSSPSRATSNFYTAVNTNLYNGFVTISKGLYTLQTNSNTISTNLTNLKSGLYSGTSFSYISAVGDGSGVSSASSVLNAVNSNLFYGLRSVIKNLGTVNTSVNGLAKSLKSIDDRLVTANSSLTSLGSKMDSNTLKITNSISQNLSLLGEKDSRLYNMLFGTRTEWLATRYDTNTGEATGQHNGKTFGFMVMKTFEYTNGMLATLVKRSYSPEDEALKDGTEDQKQELLDKFYGDGSNGVQGGQIGSLGDISSSAGDLLDTGGNIGNVFSEIGNSGSSVWSWFSSGNSNAINGSGGPAGISEDDDELLPTPEIVDFYGAQRDEFLSLLGGG